MNVLVYVEYRDGEVKKASLEALSEAKRIAGSTGGAVGAVLVGNSLGSAVDTVKANCADKIFVTESADLENFVAEGYMATMVEAAGQFDAQVVLLASTIRGRDLAPRVAAKLGTTIIPDATTIKVEGGNITATRPVFAGKVYRDISVKALPIVITTRPNVFELEASDGAGERIDLAPAYEAKSKVVEVIAASSDKLDVAEADRVVAGGRGMKDAETFKQLDELADVLGGAVGASRAVVDADWRPHSEQVGQTGKTVGPTLYIAAGISGAIQHVAGMRTSKYIVAINRDADAPIFKIADYGIVGDATEVIPAITEALK